MLPDDSYPTMKQLTSNDILETFHIYASSTHRKLKSSLAIIQRNTICSGDN